MAVAGVSSQPSTYYFGGTGGGVFKTTNGGADWKPVTDGQIATGSVGAIAVAESDPNVVYVGMGEACLRGNLSRGDGVYKSVDAGKTWANVGLKDTQHIGAVVVHPQNPDLVYVAALGHAFGPNKDRGVFRSRDGGKTWEKVHYVDENTGAVDLAMDPPNPRVLFAGMYQIRRSPWGFDSGGPGSGLFKSTDGGDTWKKLEGEGLPKGVWGKIGVSVSGANPNRVYAIIEAEEGGVFRSNDGGKTWSKANDERKLRQRAWYYTHIFADPKNADIGLRAQRAVLPVAGRGQDLRRRCARPTATTTTSGSRPNDANRMIASDDGGAHVSVDGGATWTKQDNQATAQFYHVIADDRFPYWVYGAQQDNSTVAIASRTSGAGIDRTDWYPVGGCESGYVAPKPGDANIVYAGCYDGQVTRYDHRTKQERDVTVYPENPMGWGAEGMKFRFQWTAPIVISPHDPELVYSAGNVLFQSRNGGQSWEAISPDLTRNDKTKLGPTGGPITKDNTSVEYYGTIFAFAESRLEKGLLWAGSDDGLVHVSRDAGKSWTNVTPKDLPGVEHGQPDRPLSPRPGHDVPRGEPLQARRQPALRLRDHRLRQDLAQDRERDSRRGLRARGAPGPGEQGPSLRRHRDRGLRLLRQRGEVAAPPAQPARGPHHRPRGEGQRSRGRHPGPVLLDPRRHRTLCGRSRRRRWPRPRTSSSPRPPIGSPASPSPFRTSARTPPNGALFYYSLKSDVKEGEEIVLEILDAAGKLVRKFSSKPDPDKKAGGGFLAEFFGVPGPTDQLPAKAGLNRFAWDLRYPEASTFDGMILWGGGTDGPGGRPRDLPGEAHRRRDHRHRVLRGPQGPARSPPPRPTCRSSSTCR